MKPGQRVGRAQSCGTFPFRHCLGGIAKHGVHSGEDNMARGIVGRRLDCPSGKRECVFRLCLQKSQASHTLVWQCELLVRNVSELNRSIVLSISILQFPLRFVTISEVVMRRIMVRVALERLLKIVSCQGKVCGVRRSVITSQVEIRGEVSRLFLYGLAHGQGEQSKLAQEIIGKGEQSEHVGIDLERLSSPKRTDRITIVVLLEIQKATPEISLEIGRLMADQLINPHRHQGKIVCSKGLTNRDYRLTVIRTGGWKQAFYIRLNGSVG